MQYNPQILTRNERLAYVFKKDKQLVVWGAAQRRRRNNALQSHEQLLRFPSIRREQPVRAKQYVQDVLVPVLAE